MITKRRYDVMDRLRWGLDQALDEQSNSPFVRVGLPRSLAAKVSKMLEHGVCLSGEEWRDLKMAQLLDTDCQHGVRTPEPGIEERLTKVEMRLAELEERLDALPPPQGLAECLRGVGRRLGRLEREWGVDDEG